jgi:GGDEF domain-containing protein
MPSIQPRSARPVADAPIAALLARSEELAKRWLLAVLESAPLADAPAIARAGWARVGPGLCEAALRAIVDDIALEQLSRGDAVARTVELVDGDGPLAVSSAVDALQAVMWAGLRSELRDPDADLVAALAERLARVIAVVRTVALGRSREGQRCQLDADASWIRSIEQELRRDDYADLSLLVVELEDADRLLAVEGPAGRAFGDFAGAVRGAVRNDDVVVRETASRAWLLIPNASRTTAEAIGSRISAAVRDGPPWRGAPLLASVGVAVLGQDGRSAVELIDTAQEARFAAAASGIDVFRAAPERAPADQ